MDIHLARVTREHRDSIQIKKGDIKTETEKIKNKLSDLTTKPYTQQIWRARWNGKFSIQIIS